METLRILSSGTRVTTINPVYAERAAVLGVADDDRPFRMVLSSSRHA